MQWVIRGLVCVAVAVLTALALGKAPERTWLDRNELTDLAGIRAELDARLKYVDARIVKRAEFARGVATGRLTLWQAAARLRALDRATPPLAEYGPTWPWLDRPVSEEERCCREVLRTARVGHGDCPACRARLDAAEAELEERLARGPIGLPE
jgi:hypothetical protein